MNTSTLNRYRKLGWTFQESVEVDHHNGDLDDYVYATSPRVRERFKISHGSRTNLDSITAAYLLKCELSAYVDQLMEEHSWTIDEIVRATLTKNPDAKVLTVSIPLT